MATNAFIGKPKQPTQAELNAELGKSKGLWDSLLQDLHELGATGLEWSSYSPKAGWALKVLQKRRVIVYLSPMHGGFRASFALGDRAVEAARQSTLPAKFLKIIDEARRYAEGTAVRVEVSSRSDVNAVLKLASIKMQN